MNGALDSKERLTDDGRIGEVIVRHPPAKLNLTLAILGMRPDGYHALHSVMVPLGLTDALEVRRRWQTPAATSMPRPSGATPWPQSPGSGLDTLRVSGLDAGAIEDNLVLAAIAAARAAVRDGWPGAPAEPPPLAVTLAKRIPVAAGLGGGSSDAAAAIDAALEAWAARLSPGDAAAVAAGVGSDVPFFQAGGAALVTGRGESVVALRGVVGRPPGVLLVVPRLALSTAAVFRAFHHGARPETAGSARVSSEHLAGEMARGIDARTLLARAGVLAAANDLLPAALAVAPDLVPFRRALTRVLRRPVGQSGSGPSAWVLYASPEEATHAATAVLAAIADGALPAVGQGEPAVFATTIEPAAAPAAAPDTPASARTPAAGES